MNPLVTCLCLTHNRREWLPRAIAHYLNQTYENRELLIVASGDDVSGIVMARKIWSIRLLGVDGTVGEKRNRGCEAACGDTIAVWDDDDYSAPGRLADQMARLQATGRAVTGYRALKFTDGKRWWRYNGHPGFAAGTSLCFRREWWRTHRFEDKQVGQDEEFAAVAARARELAVAEDLDLMYATIHAGNTSPRRIGGGCWQELPGFVWPEVEEGIRC